MRDFLAITATASRFNRAEMTTPSSKNLVTLLYTTIVVFMSVPWWIECVNGGKPYRKVVKCNS